jgi:hypothetical protein
MTAIVMWPTAVAGLLEKIVVVAAAQAGRELADPALEDAWAVAVQD